MKHLLALLLFMVLTTKLSAQIQKGAILLGGSVGFNNISSEGDGITYANFSPNAGFFLSDRFAIGSSLDFVLVTKDGDSKSSFGLSPFMRYYFNDSGNTRFFGQAKLGFLTGDTDYFQESTALTFGVGVGADFFLNEHVAIEGFLGYQRLQYPEYEAGLNNIGLNFGVAAFIGGSKNE